MSRRLTHISLVLVLLLSSEVWAIGLGDIQLDSALNEPLRAEISLLSTSPDELAGLTVALASADTFTRYGIDRPFYLQGIEFNVISRPNGAVVQLRSRQAMTEPFLTFLVEASWPSGRLLAGIHRAPRPAELRAPGGPAGAGSHGAEPQHAG